MKNNESSTDERLFPRFFTAWRDMFEEDVSDFTPVDYLNQGDGLLYAIAAQWLFCPVLTEYRGCVVAIKGVGDELPEAERRNLDRWLEVFEGDTPKAEAKKNLVFLSDLFTAVDTEPYEDDLSRLARTLAQCWEGLLKVQFPNREFVVEVYDDEWSHGPEITFFSHVRTGSDEP